MSAWPLVSVLIPMRNEYRFIAHCLDSVLANDYPADRVEVVVIDGMSVDGSREVVRAYCERHSCIRLLSNPKRIQAAALNMGLREARGEIIVRMDAHTRYAPDYIRKCVELLQATGADNVGGVQRATGSDYVSCAIAVATTTPFGIGNAHFRYAKREMWMDTVYLGAWRKTTLEALGGFDEDWAVNEDYESNYRLRKAGGRILLSPEIHCSYYVRPSLKALTTQFFRYGFWGVKTLRTHADSLRWRQLAPPVLVASLLVSIVLLPFSPMLGVIVPALYAAAILLATLTTAWRRGWRYLPLLPVIFIMVHMGSGLGFLTGLTRWGIPKITPSALARAFGWPSSGKTTRVSSG
jgi:succinoglycan biosynthesis protein ExoA